MPRSADTLIVGASVLLLSINWRLGLGIWLRHGLGSGMVLESLLLYLRVAAG